jgi:hypothetical protein
MNSYLILFLTLIFSVKLNVANAQDHSTVDTTITIVCLKWRTSTDPNIGAFRVSNDTIFEKHGRTSSGLDGKKFSELTSGKKYVFFVDKKNRKMMEGYWTPEGFYSSFVLYHKNGTVKQIGTLSDVGKCGKWECFNKKGRVKRTDVFTNCD